MAYLGVRYLLDFFFGLFPLIAACLCFVVVVVYVPLQLLCADPDFLAAEDRKKVSEKKIKTKGILFFGPRWRCWMMGLEGTQVNVRVYLLILEQD